MKLNNTIKNSIINEYKNKSEADFRNEVLFPLFEKMGFEVTHNHGSLEQGKDFILKEKDKLEDVKYTCVVVKNSDVNNTSDKTKETLYDIRRQVDQCWDLDLTMYGAKGLTPTSVLVVVSGTISGSARKELTDEKDSVKKNNTRYIPKEELVTLIDKYYPEFFCYKLPTVSRYLNELANYVKKRVQFENQASEILGKINTECVRDKICSTNVNTNKQVEKEKAKTKDIIKSGKILWLQGGQGSGKTYTIHQIIEEMLKQISTQEDFKKKNINLLIPIYIKARDINGRFNLNDDSFQIIKSFISEYNETIQDSELEKWFKTYNFLFVIDEFETNPDKNIITGLYNKFIVPNSKNSILILSRNMNEFEYEFSFNVEIWKLRDIDMSKAIKVIESSLPDRNEKIINKYNEIVKDGLLERLPRTPLAINVLSYIFSKEKVGDTPNNAYEFFDMFFEIIFGRWEKNRKVEDVYDYNQVRSFFSNVAFRMVENKVTIIPICKIEDIAKRILEGVNEKILSPEQYINSLKEYGDIAIIENGNFEFTHKTYQEFLAGCEFVQHHWNHDFILENITDINWEECIIFGAGSKKKDDILVDKLITIEEDTAGKKYFKLKNVAFLVQALYQSDRLKRRDAINGLIQTAINLRDSDEFKDGIEKIIKCVNESLLSILSMKIFNMYYGRPSFAPLLVELLNEVEVNSREICYLLASVCCLKLETNDYKMIQSKFDNFELNFENTEVRAIHNFLEIESKESPKSESALSKMLTSKKYKKLARKTKDIFSKKDHGVRRQ